MSLSRRIVIRFLYSKLITELEKLSLKEGKDLIFLLEKLHIDTKNYIKLKMIRDMTE